MKYLFLKRVKIIQLTNAKANLLLIYFVIHRIEQYIQPVFFCVLQIFEILI